MSTEKRLHVHVTTDGAAFDDNERPELARILREIADRIESGDDMDTYRNVLDVNGNVAGTFAYKCDACDNGARRCSHERVES